EARSYYYLARRIRPGMGPESLPPEESSPLWDREKEQVPRVSGHKQNYLNLAIELITETEPQKPDGPLAASFKHLLALCYRERAEDNHSRRTDQDWVLEEKSINLLRELVEDYPEQDLFRFDLLETLAEVKVFGDSVPVKQVDYLKDHLEVALDEANYLVKQRPDVVEYRIALIHSNFKLAEILKLKSESTTSEDRSELLELAEQLMQRAIFEQRNLVQVHPSALGYRVWLIRFFVSMAELKMSQGKLGQAERFVNRAASAFSHLPDSAGTHWIVGALESEIADLTVQVQKRIAEQDDSDE
ncbi:MAG: hypothetical protein P8K79_06625, partial [Mariniblastus sp.]|nr:hypothetical protein [Mariniblastus sp.]